MAWIEVKDYGVSGWSGGADSTSRSRHYCSDLEQGAILYFPTPPFTFLDEHWKFLVSLKPADSRLHKNISYRPETHVLRGFDDSERRGQVYAIMRGYSKRVREFVSDFLSPYGGKLQMDYASFRPIEEEGRNLSLRKRNDLLHVDAFPSRPTRGARILRVFTNVNPQKARIWVVGERFPTLADRFALSAGLNSFAREASLTRVMNKSLGRVGLIPNRAPYDRFMLHFHDWLKENSGFQEQTEGKERLEFSPMATWLVFTDGVPHAVLSGQFAIEQTFIVPREALVAPEVSPIGVLERLSGRAMA